jgi:PAS domain S-box-containing protein
VAGVVGFDPRWLPVARRIEANRGGFTLVESRQKSVDLLAAVEAVRQEFSSQDDCEQAGEQVLRLLTELPERHLELLEAAVIAAQRARRQRESNGSHCVCDDLDRSSHVESQTNGTFERRDALTKLDSGKLSSQSQESLREQYAILQTILESTTDFVYMKDRQGRYITANSAAANFVGHPLEEIIGRRDEDFFPAEIAREIQARDQRLFADEVEQRFEKTIPIGDRVHHFSTSKNICRDTAGNVIGLVGITRDITAHVEALEALRQSTALLENIVENIPLAVFVKDPKDSFRVRLWNKAAESIFGVSREDMIGSNAYDFWPKDQADYYHSIDQQVMKDGQFREIAEESSTSQSGGPIVVHTRKMPLYDREGEPSLLLAICEDVTARKRSQEALEEAQRRLAITLKGAEVGIWDWDLASNTVNFSEAWKSQLGYTKDEVANHNMEWQSRVHPEDLDQALANVRNTIERKTAEYRSEFRLRHKDGSWRWILSLGSVIDDPDGKPARMLGVHVDITDRKQYEQALMASEARYRTFVDHASDALFLQDRDGRIVDVNTQACISLGYTRQELIGMLPFQFDSDIAPDHTELVLQQLESGETIAFDSTHKRKDGSTFPVEVRLRPFWINGERFHVGLVRDITERKRTEQALRESEARLRTLLENLDKVAVQAYEADGTITFWNRASEIFYGYSAADALGRSIVELLFGKATQDAERRIMAEAMSSGKSPIAEEIELLRRDGSSISVFSSRVVHPRPGRSPEFFCFDVDVSERKRAEEELAIRQSEMLHASRLTTVGQMVVELSHEVAQPLSAIDNFAAASEQILHSGSDPDLTTLSEYVSAIVKQSERCATILERLRDFSRRTPARRSECDLGELLRDSVELIASELRSHHVVVRIELDDALPAVRGDRVQLQQVVVNLLANARDAVQDQPPERRLIVVRASADDDVVVFEIADRGCGISGEVADRLFDPFFTTKEHGTGIGLGICQSIVKEHGGWIEAYSNPEGGATFCVRIPLLERRRT